MVALGLSVPADSRPAILGPALIASLLANAVLLGVVYNRQRAYTRMREAEQAFRDLYENISEGVFRSTLDGLMISANPSLVRLNGYETEAEMLAAVNDIGSEWYVDPGRRAEIHEMLLRDGQVVGAISEIYRHKTRERIWVEENTRLVRDKETGEPLYYDGTVREVTETVRRLELQDRYTKIASIVSGCLYEYRVTPRGATSMPYASVGLVHLFGVEPSAVREDASVLFSRIHPEDIQRVNASIEFSRATLKSWQCEFRVRTPEGQEKWIFGHSVPTREADGSTRWHGFMTDISERKSSEAKIYDLAYFDPLTRLPNRTMLRDRLKRAVVSGERDGPWSALLFIDIDDFKLLNDTKGHDVGDQLLCEIADRLRNCVRSIDLVARLGGDEFVVLLRRLSRDGEAAREDVRRRGERIVEALAEPFSVDGNPFQTSASVGAALFRAAGTDVDDLLKRADLAMYEAKAAGRNALCFFEPGMQRQVDERVALTADLRDALAHDRLALALQPLVDRSGRWIGAEALLRWSHPTRGPIPPTEILALAERDDLSDDVEDWVIRRACATLRTWADDQLARHLQLSLNVSARRLNAGDFVATIREALAATGADSSRLTLELTEHLMLDKVEEVSATMLELRALGISFAIDDFGTGYSSLSYLKRLPLNLLKIDQSFVRDLESDPSDRAIVATIVMMARSLELGVVAEGVETELQSMLLRRMGCDTYQGYLFGRPMAPEDFLAALHDQSAADMPASRAAGAQ